MIREKALYYVGQEEIPGNQGFKDKKFEELMKLTGWRQGQAWCAYFVELVWTQCGQDASLFSGSAVQTWRNFENSDKYVCSDIPDVGDIIIWQMYRNGKAAWTGHAGIVIAIDNGVLVTVEGNTNSKGGREGIEVAIKIRKVNYATNNGLRVKGFIKPIIHNP